MLYKLETQEGVISVDRAVVSKIIVEAVKEFNGKVMLSNHKGKISGLTGRLGIGDDKAYSEIDLDEDGLGVRVYIVIRFGTSITKVTEQLIATIKKNIEAFVGMEANHIAIVVTGVVSKQMVKRNIVVKG